MSKIGWIAAVLAGLALASAAWIVLSHDAARSQLLSLHFPLDDLGEAVLGMLIPLALSAVASVLAVVAWVSIRRVSPPVCSSAMPQVMASKSFVAPGR